MKTNENYMGTVTALTIWIILGFIGVGAYRSFFSKKIPQPSPHGISENIASKPSKMLKDESVNSIENDSQQFAQKEISNEKFEPIELKSKSKIQSESQNALNESEGKNVFSKVPDTSLSDSNINMASQENYEAEHDRLLGKQMNILDELME